MAEQNQRIVFRRIRGRIVPIKKPFSKTEPRKSELVKGAGYSAAGVGVGVATGLGAAKVTGLALEKKAAGRKFFGTAHYLSKSNFYNNSGKQLSLFARNPSESQLRLKAAATSIIKAGKRRGVALRGAAMAIKSFKNPILIGGGVVAGTLFVKSMDNIIGEKRNRRIGLSGDVIKTAAATAAVGVLGVTYYGKFGLPMKAAFETTRKYMKGGRHLIRGVPVETKFGKIGY